MNAGGQRARGGINWLLWLTAAFTGGLGAWNLMSAARGFEGDLAMLQTIYLAFGLLVALGIALIDYHIFERIAYPLFFLSLLSLLAVLAVGRVASGSRRWIPLGLFNFQPSEMAKIAVILALAKYFSDESDPPAAGYRLWDLIKPATPFYPLGALGALILFWEKAPLAEAGHWRFLMLAACMIWAALSVLYVYRVGRTSLHDMLSPVIPIVLPAILIIRQPDLGTSLALAAVAGTIILFMKVRFRSLLIAAAVLVAASVASWYLVLEPYQKGRIEAFLSPGTDTMGSGYHAYQSIIAVGSGRLHGKGFMESTQTKYQFLPEQHTDFVFSVWAEERGFIGCALVLGLFLFLLVQIVNIASGARDRFGVLIGVGMAGMVFWHLFINVGMVIGVLPVVGITLPLWSYGGSSVVAILVGVGLLMSVSRHKRA
ncbi:MAG: rod shape-determining protein RodA [Deltaproteobacteria bacterium]|nr:rod shape-determining protein RodA [Deltaproteobacteria bacterium]